MQSLEPDVLLSSELSALADFLQRIQPVIDYLEAEKNTLPPRLRALLESDSEAECDLSPSEVTALLRQTNLPRDMLDDVTALAEDAERSIKWEQDCKAFLEQVIAATGAAKLASTPGSAISIS
ncbi:hypothetical protein C8Q76DRAFT_688346 [Earliella scabrosa]|nr:hypothetical protein C8Q76DRAFT_688346 [Earliella scabrosa]